MKKTLALLLAAAMVMTTVLGCGGSNNNSAGGSTANPASTQAPASDAASTEAPGSQAPAEGDVTLRFSWWGNQMRADQTMAVANLYTERHPNVKFDMEYMDFSGYWDKMQTLAAGQNLPDVYQHSVAYTIEYERAGLMLNLDPYIESGALDTTDIPAAAVESGRVGDHIYAVNLGTNCKIFHYNKTLLDEAGITLPDRLTYEDLMTIGKEVYEKTGAKTEMITPGTSPQEHFSMIIRALGSHMYEDMLAGNSENIRKAFEYCDQLNKAEWALPFEEWAEIGTAIEEAPIITGVVWNQFLNSNQYVAMQALCDFELGAAQWPSIEGAVAEDQWMRASQLMSAAANTPYPDQAVDFINFFINDMDANDIMKGERGVPINTKILQHLSELTDDSATKISFAFVEEVGKVAVMAEDDWLPGNAEITTLIQTLIEDLYYGDKTVDECAEELTTEGARILRENGN